MPKFSKVACRLMPSHGFSSLQTGREGQPSVLRQSPSRGRASRGRSPSPRPPLRIPTTTLGGACRLSPAHGRRREAQGGGAHAGAQARVSPAPPPAQGSVPEGGDRVGEGRPPGEPCLLEPILYCPGHSACRGGPGPGWTWLVGPEGACPGVGQLGGSKSAPTHRPRVGVWTQASISQPPSHVGGGGVRMAEGPHPPLHGLLRGHLPKALMGQSGVLSGLPPAPSSRPSPAAPQAGFTHPASRRAPPPGRRR